MQFARADAARFRREGTAGALRIVAAYTKTTQSERLPPISSQKEVKNDETHFMGTLPRAILMSIIGNEPHAELLFQFTNFTQDIVIQVG